MPVGLAYVRQSKARAGEDAERSLSLAAQEQRIREWADRERWGVVDVVRDHDLSGDSMDRPGWIDVVSRVQAGGIDAVLVFAMSRVARDFLLQEIAFRELVSYGAKIISVSEPGAEDDMMRGFLGVISQAERKRMGRFISAAAHERQRRGIWVGGKLSGFRKTGHPGERGRNLEPDPETAPQMVQVVRMALAGEPFLQIAHWLNANDVPNAYGSTWTATTVGKWLRNPSIAGAVTSRDGIVWDAFPGIIDRATWERLQTVVASRQRLRNQVEVDHWLRGQVVHGCGRRMILNRVTSGRKSIHFRCPGYIYKTADRCTSPPYTLSATKISDAVREALARDLASVVDPDAIVAEWHASQNGADIIRRRSQITRELIAADTTHERAEALYLNGRRDAAWLAEQDAVHVRTAARLRDELAELDSPPDIAVLRDVRAMLTDVRVMIDLVAPDELSQVLRELGVVVVEGRTVRIRYQAEIALLIPSPAVMTLP